MGKNGVRRAYGSSLRCRTRGPFKGGLEGGGAIDKDDDTKDRCTLLARDGEQGRTTRTERQDTDDARQETREGEEEEGEDGRRDK